MTPRADVSIQRSGCKF